MKNTSETGIIGEQAATEFLKKNGYDIIGRNYKNNWGRRKGEIDIIAKDGNELVFVEVKTRKSERYYTSLPEENINHAKLQKLARIADEYLRHKNMLGADHRFDAVSVWLDTASRPVEIKHLRNIFL